MEILIGLLSGIFTSIGIGGGTILILFLTIFFNVEQRIAQAINLICFIPASIVSIIYNFKKKNINLRNTIPIIICGVIGSVIGCLLSKSIDLVLLKKLFGIYLFFISIYEIYNLFKFIKSNN